MVVILMEATIPWMTEMMVFTIATGAEITATSLNNGTPKTKKIIEN